MAAIPTRTRDTAFRDRTAGIGRSATRRDIATGFAGLNRRRLAAGNWKMNGLRTAAAEIHVLATEFVAPRCEILICPPATLLACLTEIGGPIAFGGQDCHQSCFGPHTGDVSAVMLRDAGATHVILGHSERRSDHGESDALVRAKAETALAQGLTVLICIGETAAQRYSGITLPVVGTQLSGSVPDDATAANCVIAYEPVWSIGTGRIPTFAEIAEVHEFIRSELRARFADGDGFRVIYGGSVKPDNAAAIFAIADVDGALVGGAALKARDFAAIISALDALSG